MKRTMLSLLVVGVFAGVGTSAMAQVNTTGAEDQPAANTQGMTVPGDNSTAQQPATRAERTDAARTSKQTTAAQDEAATQYQDAKAKCDSLQGDPKRTCLTEATTARNDALAEANTQSDPVGAANAAGDAKSGNDGMGNSSGSPKYAQ